MNQTGRILEEVKKAVCGKDHVLVWVLTVLLARGHVLLEDIPGVGKTTMALAFSRALGLEYGRVQFTPDVLPSDITGYSVYQKETGKLVYQPGAVLCNLFLADELNRATSRTQSALLEAMEEGQVTVDGNTYKMPQPFIVMATQNPVEFVGTYPLPEAQMDRFFMRISIGYPSVEDEMEILERYSAPVSPLSTLQPVCSAEDIIGMQAAVTEIYCSREVRSYVANITASTRRHPALQLGVSTRGAIALIKAAQANALLAGRDFILPEDVQRMALPVLCHRVMLSPEARMQGDTADRIVSDIVNNVQVPVRVK